MKKIIYTLAFILLSACHAEEPADLKNYLLQHPQILNNEISICDKQKELSKRCEIVLNAGSEIRDLIEEQQRDPQAFGKRILTAEMEQPDSDEVKKLLAVVGMTGPE